VVYFIYKPFAVEKRYKGLQNSKVEHCGVFIKVESFLALCFYCFCLH